MRIVQLTVDLAFEDFQVGHQCGDFVADKIAEVCMEKLDAEVADIRLVSERSLPIDDFSGIDDYDDGTIEKWHEQARADFQRYSQVSKP